MVNRCSLLDECMNISTLPQLNHLSRLLSTCDRSPSPVDVSVCRLGRSGCLGLGVRTPRGEPGACGRASSFVSQPMDAGMDVLLKLGLALLSLGAETERSCVIITKQRKTMANMFFFPQLRCCMLITMLWVLKGVRVVKQQMEVFAVEDGTPKMGPSFGLILDMPERSD